MKLYYEDDAAGIRIYHGDCTDPAMAPMWDTGNLAVMVTDPPYGMSFRTHMISPFRDESIVGDSDTNARDLMLALWGARPALVFGRWSVPRPPHTRMVLIWEKGEHVGMGDLELPWKPNTEEIYVLGSGFSGHRSTSVLRAHAVAGTVGMAANGTRRHPVEKPVGIIQQLLLKCPPGAVFDPFLGSGTTLRAAKNLGRPAVGIEIEERYCAIAADRLRQEVLQFV